MLSSFHAKAILPHGQGRCGSQWEAVSELRTRAAFAQVGLRCRPILDSVWVATGVERGSSKSSKLRKEVSNVRAREIAEAIEEYRQRQRSPRPLDPFYWLQWLFDKSLLLLQRMVRRLVETVVR